MLNQFKSDYLFQTSNHFFHLQISLIRFANQFKPKIQIHFKLNFSLKSSRVETHFFFLTQPTWSISLSLPFHALFPPSCHLRQDARAVRLAHTRAMRTTYARTMCAAYACATCLCPGSAARAIKSRCFRTRQSLHCCKHSMCCQSSHFQNRVGNVADNYARGNIRSNPD